MTPKSKENVSWKKQFEYQIPDFCPCEEIYDSERAIMIGEGSYYNENGLKTTTVLNSETTIIKYSAWRINETPDSKD